MEKIYIIGHKNPDTDSVCSAICYAYYKNMLTGTENYIPAVAGHLNEETQFVLDYSGVETPILLHDIYRRLDENIVNSVVTVNSMDSLQHVCNIMQEHDFDMIPITENNKLKGLITTKGIMKYSYMLMNHTLTSMPETPISNIISSLNGKLLAGNPDALIKPKAIVLGLDREVKDLTGCIVVSNDRTSRQIEIINSGVSCLIVCGKDIVSDEVTTLAKEKNCYLIHTHLKLYIVVRLVHHSTSVKDLMTPANSIIHFKLGDTISSVKEEMKKHKFNNYPVVDENGNYLGIISKAGISELEKTPIILVDHNEKSQAIDGIDDTTIVEIIDHHRLGSLETSLPLYFRNQPLGCTATIIYQMLLEKQILITPSIATLLCSAIISDTLLFKSPICTDTDREACFDLATIAGIDPHEYGMQMFRAGSNPESKTDEEILFGDYKEYTISNIKMGIAQTNSMNIEEVMDIVVRMVNFVPQALSNSGADVLFLLVTDIISETSYTVFAGKGARELLESAFNIKKSKADFVALKNIVSRKKQFLPAIIEYCGR